MPFDRKPVSPSALEQRVALRVRFANQPFAAPADLLAAKCEEARKRDRWPKAVALVVGLLLLAFALSTVSYVRDSRFFFAMWVFVSLVAVGSRMSRDIDPAYKNLEQ